MKKIVLSLLTAILFAATASAQSWRTQGRDSRSSSKGYNDFYYGLRLGLGISTVNSDDALLDAPGSRTGLNLGAVAGLQLSPRTPVYLESGLCYSEKGGKYTRNNCDLKYNLNYLKVPIVVKYAIELDYDISVVPHLGGYLAHGISGKIKDYNTRESWSAFCKSNFRHFDGGLIFGCGVSYDVLYAEINYELGLANISHDDFAKAHNGTFNLNIGVNF